MWKLAIFICLYSILVESINGSSTYDQRQTGDFNVHIGLKNLNIIALLKGGKEEYVDYDYAYDYSEMTIKPPNGTTIKPLNETSTVTSIEIQQLANSTTAALQEQSTETNANVTSIINTTETIEDKIRNDTLVTTTAKLTDIPQSTTTILPEVTNAVTDSSSDTKNCRRGFVHNNQGKCEFKLHGTSNALRRIVKLAQKIKIGREYTAE